MLASYADAKIGLVTHGWITKIEKHGCFVRFYNGVQGFVSRLIPYFLMKFHQLAVFNCSTFCPHSSVDLNDQNMVFLSMKFLSVLS